jgi:hypothetical protein
VTADADTARVPRWVVAVAVVVLAAAVVMMAVGAWQVGTTWDERVQVTMLQTFLDQGWHMTPDALIDGVPDPKYFYGSFVYGPVGELLPHLVNVALGNESWSATATDAAAFAGRHLGVALTALAGVAGAAGAVRVATRSWSWALLGAALLAVTPLWLGHGMFNIKDVPAATGYTLATAGLMAFLRTDYFSSRSIRLWGIGALAGGAVLAAGTRTALGLPIAFAVPVSLFMTWLVARRAGRDQAVALRASRRFVEALVTMVGAYVLLTLIYPKAFVNPINLGIKAILDSALYPVNEAQLVAGTWMTQPVSWTYLPLWFGAQLPLIVSGFALVGLGWWAVDYVARVARPAVAPAQVERAALPIPVVLQALLLPAGAIVGHSTLYNGSRQMLFVVPALVILATLGIRTVVGALRARTGRWAGRLGLVTWLVVAAGLVVTLVAQGTLFPYNYTYFNAAATLRPIDGNWATDYWRAGGRELMARLPAQGPESCGFEQLQKGRFMPCSDQPMFQPYLDDRGSAALPAVLGPTEYWFVRENSGPLDLPPGCRLHDQIVRRLYLQEIVIGQIAICDRTVDTGRRNLADPTKPVGS